MSGLSSELLRKNVKGERVLKGGRRSVNKLGAEVLESEVHFPSQFTTNQVEKEASAGLVAGWRSTHKFPAESVKYKTMQSAQRTAKAGPGRAPANGAKAHAKTMKKSFSVQLNKSFQYKSNFNEKKMIEWIEASGEAEKGRSKQASILNSFRVNMDNSDDHIFQNNFRRAGERKTTAARQPEPRGQLLQVVGIGSHFRGSFGKKKAEELSSKKVDTKGAESGASPLDRAVYNSFNQSLEEDLAETKAVPRVSKPVDRNVLTKQSVDLQALDTRGARPREVRAGPNKFPKISLLKQFIKNVDFDDISETKMALLGQRVEGPVSFKIPSQPRQQEPEVLKKSMSQPLKTAASDAQYRVSETTREPSYSRVSKRPDQASPQQPKKPRFTFQQRQININELKKLFEQESERLKQPKQESSQLILDSPPRESAINRTSLERLPHEDEDEDEHTELGYFGGL